MFQSSFTIHGLSSLVANGVSLSPTPPVVYGVTLQRADGSHYDGSVETLPPTWDSATRTLVLSYSWGTITIHWDPRPGQVDIATNIVNTSIDTIMTAYVQATSLMFPVTPLGKEQGWPYVAYSEQGPAFISFEIGAGQVVLAEETGEAGHFIAGLGNNGTNDYCVVVGPSLPARWSDSPVNVTPSIPAGATWSSRVSIRFVHSATSLSGVGDLINRFRSNHPSHLTWTDRRMIGCEFLASSERTSATNPNGWFDDPTLDATTPGGIAQFHALMLARAKNDCVLLKEVNAQGIVLWDLEGERQANIKYVGDPRLVKTFAPEMDGVIDDVFRMYAAAGLKTGVCLRASDCIQVNGIWTQQPTSDLVQSLSNRISYAMGRWGCTLFYVDSVSADIDPDVWVRLAIMYPSVLLMPEHCSIAAYGQTAPYTDTTYMTSTPALARAVYAKSFSVIRVMSVVDPAVLAAAVKGGDVLMGPAWYQSPQWPAIKTAYGV